MAVSHNELMYIYYNVLFFYAIQTFDKFRWIVCPLLVQITGKFFNITAGRPDFSSRAGRMAAGKQV